MKKIFLVLCGSILWFGCGIKAQQDNNWTLEKCIAYALEQNIQVRKSSLSNQSLEFLAEQTKAQRFPSVNASVSQNFDWSKNSSMIGSGNTVYENSLSGSNSSSYSVSSGVTLFNASKISNQIKQSELDIEGGKFSLEATKESISLSILNAFLQVLYAEELVKNSEKQIESTSEQVNLAGERLNLQVISQSDYLQVKSQLASEKLTLANANSQLAIARVNLMQLMELPVSDNFTIAQPNMDTSLNQNRTPDVQAVYGTALSIKPQIKNAAINKEIASLDEKIARAGYFPSLSASAGVTTRYSGQSSDTYFNQLDNRLSPSLGLSLAIPIYQKKQVKTSIALAKIGYQNAELSETDTKNQLRKNIEQASVDVSSAQIEYEASLEKYQSTKESSALSDEKFTQGIINSVDFMVSKTNLIVAESQLLQSKYNLIFSYKILDFYLGIPLSL
jgi:outer membrane protein